MGHRLPIETWRIVFILALVMLTITSTILIPGVLLPNITSPHPEFLTDDLQDEWRELQQRTISRPHILLLGASISALVYVWCIFYYGKLTNAIWFGWMPVGVAAIGLDPPVVCLRAKDRLVQQPVFPNTELDHPHRIRGVCSEHSFSASHMTEQAPPARE